MGTRYTFIMAVTTDGKPYDLPYLEVREIMIKGVPQPDADSIGFAVRVGAEMAARVLEGEWAAAERARKNG